MFVKVTRLVCGRCGHRYNARDAGGNVRVGSATVRRIIADRIIQTCPKCGHTKDPEKLFRRLFEERRRGLCER
jgi:hypothetical protein